MRHLATDAVLALFAVVLAWLLVGRERPLSLVEQRENEAHRTEDAVFEFALVADLDEKSRDPQMFRWHSILKKGHLRVDRSLRRTGSRGKTLASVKWSEELDLSCNVATNNRSMELSDFVWWNGKYLACCDYTGLVYKIRPRQGDVFPRFVLADGDGKRTKTIKSEWMATKDGSLYIGSHGKEWVKPGRSHDYGGEWVKVIDPNGAIRSEDWGLRYQALRKATNTTFPGYLSHEAVVFNPFIRKWMFLPRKESTIGPYDNDVDETRGTNLLVLVDEDWTDITVQRIGPLEMEWGFTGLAIVPKTDGFICIATKVLEIGSRAETRLVLFDLDGTLLFEEGALPVAQTEKYEGVGFLGIRENW